MLKVEKIGLKCVVNLAYHCPWMVSSSMVAMVGGQYTKFQCDILIQFNKTWAVRTVKLVQDPVQKVEPVKKRPVRKVGPVKNTVQKSNQYEK